jgi:hypothetical protein
MRDKIDFSKEMPERRRPEDGAVKKRRGQKAREQS